MVSSELESQLRECYGRVVYSHKTHEKCADRLDSRLRAIKLAQLVLSAITTGGLITVLFGNPEVSRLAAIIAGAFSTALLALTAYTKDFDPGQMSQEHKAVADRLWVVRESYLSLLTDTKSGALNESDASVRRDELQDELATIYESAPRTFKAGYLDAQKALKIDEDLTFSDKEIDRFLPEPLRARID